VSKYNAENHPLYNNQMLAVVEEEFGRHLLFAQKPIVNMQNMGLAEPLLAQIRALYLLG
jgi:hypothetical protein